MYLTLDEYENMLGSRFLGSDELYERMEHMARMYIDRLTSGRIVGETPVRKNVKYAMFDSINALRDRERARENAGAGVASMSNDGVSVSYASVGSIDTDTEKRIRDAAKLYLEFEKTSDDIPLLYRGAW